MRRRFMMSGGESFIDVDNFLVVGDSIAAGLTGHTASTLPAAGTAYEYDRNTNTIINFGSGAGISGFSFNAKSPWAKFCIDYYANTGRKACIINRAASASTISPAISGLVGNDWHSTGTNYNAAISAVADCLNKTNKASLKGIFMIAGINDVQGQSGTGAFSVAQVSGYLTDLLVKLRTDLGTDVPIVMCQIGRHAADAISSRLTGIRNALKSKLTDYSNVYFGASLTAFEIANFYSDDIHPNVNGNDALGSMFGRWWKNSSYTKWARAIISCHFDEISTSYKNRIEAWLSTYQTLYLGMDMFYQLKTTLRANAGFDWTFLCGPESDGGFTFNTNADVRTGTTSTVFNLGYNQNETAINVLTNDYGLDVKTTVVTTASLVSAYYTGIVNTGPTRATVLGQLNTGGVNHAVLSGTSFTDVGEPNLAAGDWIIERVSSATTNLRKNGTIVDTQADSAVGAVSGDWILGCRRLNGVAGLPIDAQFTRIILFKPSLISSYATFLADLDTLQS